MKLQLKMHEYAARDDLWRISSSLVPLMHSNTQAGFTLTVNSIYSADWDIWKAFDGRKDTSFSTQHNSPVTTITVSLPSPQICNLLSIYPRTDYLHQAFGGLKLEGMDGSGTWTTLYSAKVLSPWKTDIPQVFYIPNQVAFSLYRITGTPVNGQNCLSVTKIELLRLDA